MTEKDPFAVFFGDLAKLGPSSPDITVEVLRSLPEFPLSTIVDAGCGTGAQTLPLAAELRQKVNAIDNNQGFLNTLMERAKDAGLNNLIETHCLDLSELAVHFQQIGLLWSEGAAYSIGFEAALMEWKNLLAPNGLAVISELCWITNDIPDQTRNYFNAGYPGMKTVEENLSLIENIGFEILNKRVLPTESWTEGYYDVLRPRAKSMLDHQDDDIRELAREMIEEVSIFDQSNGCYSYVIFAMRVTR